MSSIKAEYDRKLAARDNWHQIWQILGEYVSQVKQNYEITPQNGEFLQDDVYDSTGTFAANNCASALLGMLWPASAAQNIELSPPDDMDTDSTAVAEFYERMTKRLTTAMDSPSSNLSIALDEYMLDQVIIGTSGIGVEFDEDGQPYYTPYGVKEMVYATGRRGKVTDIYLAFEWEAQRVVDTYGEESVSKEVRDAVKEGGYKKIKIIHAIRERKEKKAEEGSLAMPYESIHIEYASEHPLKETGFHEMPISVGRFRKLNYEDYGRSPAMNALPDIREANALKEAVILATEKNLDPPMGVVSDGVLGGGDIDTSAGSYTVFDASGSVGGKNPIFPLQTVGSLADAMARLEDLKDSISQHFYIDRLLDLNNDQQMTFGEAQIRDQLRTSSLSSLLSRQIAEVITPVIERTVAGMWRAGAFGVLAGSEEEAEAIARGEEPEHFPDEVAERLNGGKDIYTIRYKTKAATAARAQEYMSILDLMNIGAQFIQLDSGLRHRIDFHEGIKVLASIRGTPTALIRQDDEVEQLAQQDRQQQEAAQALEAGGQLAQIGKTVAEAEAK